MINSLKQYNFSKEITDNFWLLPTISSRSFTTAGRASKCTTRAELDANDLHSRVVDNFIPKLFRSSAFPKRQTGLAKKASQGLILCFSSPVVITLLEKRFIRTSEIHFLYRLINVVDTINKKRFLVSADVVFLIASAYISR
jgi:hypothetical protein